MERLNFDVSCFGESATWLSVDTILDEDKISANEAKLREDMKALLFPETNFTPPGMDRKASEEELDSGESSGEEMDDFTDVEPIAT